jgi:hypothetical protein
MVWAVGTTSAAAVSGACGPWVVAVGGVEEMLVTVGVWSPFSPPAIAGPPAAGLLLVVTAQVQIRVVGRVSLVARA